MRAWRTQTGEPIFYLGMNTTFPREMTNPYAPYAYDWLDTRRVCICCLTRRYVSVLMIAHAVNALFAKEIYGLPKIHNVIFVIELANRRTQITRLKSCSVRCATCRSKASRVR